jgi:cell division protein ZapB
MVNELNALESKIAQVVSLCNSLRAENTQLKQQLAAAESDKQTLSERMELARGRLEQLVLQLPETKNRV